jgi:hypothetical protein
MCFAPSIWSVTDLPPSGASRSGPRHEGRTGWNAAEPSTDKTVYAILSRRSIAAKSHPHRHIEYRARRCEAWPAKSELDPARPESAPNLRIDHLSRLRSIRSKIIVI